MLETETGYCYHCVAFSFDVVDEFGCECPPTNYHHQHHNIITIHGISANNAFPSTLPLQELQDINEQIQRYREDFEHTYNIQYGISEDCTNTCQYNDDFNSNSAYYMTGNFYLGAWITKCACKCGRCTDHCECTGNNDNVKPSIELKNHCNLAISIYIHQTNIIKKQINDILWNDYLYYDIYNDSICQCLYQNSMVKYNNEKCMVKMMVFLIRYNDGEYLRIIICVNNRKRFDSFNVAKILIEIVNMLYLIHNKEREVLLNLWI